MSEPPFLRPRLIGDRFEDHSIPLEFLKDLAVLEQMIVEVAKLEFFKEHSDRKRSPRGFTEGISLKLTDVAHGSAVPIIGLAVEPDTLFPTKTQVYFERARDAIVRAIDAAGRESTIGSILPEKILGYFDKFGRSLRNGEIMELTVPKQRLSAKLTRETRRRLVLAASNVEELTEDVAVRGTVPAIDLDEMTLQVMLVDGRKIKAPIAPQHLDAVLEAFNGYENGLRVLFQGVGRVNRSDKLLGFESIEHVNLLDELDVSAQIDELRSLQDGWLEGGGRTPTGDELDWLSRAFDRYYPDDLPLPYLYPTELGGVQAEWSLGRNEVTLEMNLAEHSGYFHALRMENDVETTRTLNLDEDTDWGLLRQAIADMSENEK